MLATQTRVLGARHLQGLASLIGLLGAAWVLAGWIVAGQSTKLVLAGLVLIGGAVALAILNDWRSGIYLFVIWLLLEDLARKYLGNNMVVYFGKDLLVGVTYISFLLALRRGQVQTFRPPFLIPLSLFIWFGILQVFNPNSPSFWYGVLGVKLYFYYVPLLFLGYAFLRSEMDLRRLLVLNLALAGIIALLGVIQAIVGPDFLNPAVMAPELANLGRMYRYAPISGARLLRPNSIFVSDGRFASFLLLMWLLGLAAGTYLLPRARRGRGFIFLGAALVAAAIVLSGSRGGLGLWYQQRARLDIGLPVGRTRVGARAWPTSNRRRTSGLRPGRRNCCVRCLPLSLSGGRSLGVLFRDLVSPEPAV